MRFRKKCFEAAGASAACGTMGAAIGGSVVAAVCAVGGSFFGPVGTFFGAEVGSYAGAAVGGAIGSIVGAIGGFFSKDTETE